MASGNGRTAGTADGLDFTERARHHIRSAVGDPYFRDSDPEIIYATLQQKIRMLSFGDHLRRFIYQRAGFSEAFAEIPTGRYRDWLCREFEARWVPASFTSKTTKLTSAAGNWLERRAVSRNVVFLLGFGLKMTTEEVNTFLSKALMEQQINSKEPMEVICWYCFENGLDYAEFERLRQAYLGISPDRVMDTLMDSTVGYKRRMSSIRNEEQLLRYLLELPQTDGLKHQSVTARNQFDRLYAQTCGMVAEMMNDADREDSAVLSARLQDRLSRSDALYDYQKQRMVAAKRKNFSQREGGEIGPADIEQWVLASLPKDAHGNLLPVKKSRLSEQFEGKRLSRQHLGDILSGRAPVTRYDLMTLQFFVLSGSEEDPPARYRLFVDETNRTLENSNMAPLYMANPYESFLMMCMLADDPLGSFADIWEMSYEDPEEERE